ncbi:unnamed protein product [Peronospora destructor]|uniref:V-SNARE coiled-coil homology domain-containing protein n=1 Tax=Peronospora destructor TaxID=86335 RepID=A0AAV0V455_9STRA|nr:unnamed protein product [Peronospora destructor]
MAEQRRRVKYLIPHAQFFLIRDVKQRRNKYFARKEPADEDVYGLVPNEVAIDSEDFCVMRDSIDQMQQQLSRGLQDLKELGALMKEAVDQREGYEMINRRADTERQPQQ